MPQAIRVIDDIVDLSATGFAADEYAQWDGTQFVGATPSSLPTKLIIVDQNGGGDFVTIKAACDYAVAQGGGYYTILVMPGVYASETAMTIPANTSVVGLGGSGQSGSVYILWQPNATSGALITLAAASSALSSIYALVWPAGPLIGDAYLVGSTVTGIVSNCSINLLSSDATYNFYCVYGRVYVEYSVLNRAGGGANQSLIYWNGAGGQVKFSWLRGAAKYYIHNAAGSSTVFHCRFGEADGTMASTYDIYVQTGAVYINNTPYKTSSGTVTHIDGALATVPGLVKKAAHVADADGTLASVTAQFNALLDSLEAAGTVATS